MARRAEPPDSLDWFPTPPWATRALLERVLFERLDGDDWPVVVRRCELGRWGDDQGWPGFPVKLSVLEPAAGEGHMAEVLREYSTGSMRRTSSTTGPATRSPHSSAMASTCSRRRRAGSIG